MLSQSAQTTVASIGGLVGLSGSKAVTVPFAKGPRLVGAVGLLPMTIDCRNDRACAEAPNYTDAEHIHVQADTRETTTRNSKNKDAQDMPENRAKQNYIAWKAIDFV